jgi:hypothetical protein
MKRIGKKLFLQNGKLLGIIVLDYLDLSQEERHIYLKLGCVGSGSLVAVKDGGYNSWSLSGLESDTYTAIAGLIKKYFKEIDFETQRFWFYTNLEMEQFKIKNNLLNNE